jgi:hypothetical protein
MPIDPVDTIIHVLAKELDGYFYDDIEDTLDLHYPPFNSRTNKAKKVVFLRRPDFEKFNREQLDPFQRFTKTTYEAPAHFFRRWSNKSRLSGTIFEALVACHLIYSNTCYNCKYPNVLRWNGGIDCASSWADLVCIRCHSTFEVKSKGSVDYIEKSVQYNNLSGGRFQSSTAMMHLWRKYSW